MARITCPRCGAENSQGDNFCGDCGVALSNMAPSVAQAQKGIDRAIPSLSETSSGGKLAVSAKAKLVVKSGGKVGREFAIDRDVVNIGRWDAEAGIFPEVDLSDDDPQNYVSRKHARIFLKDNEYFVEDMSSVNGTYVNKGPRLAPDSPHKLQNGDEIIMGRILFDFVVR